jgi:hypothetical protein
VTMLEAVEDVGSEAGRSGRARRAPAIVATLRLVAAREGGREEPGIGYEAGVASR